MFKLCRVWTRRRKKRCFWAVRGASKGRMRCLWDSERVMEWVDQKCACLEGREEYDELGLKWYFFFVFSFFLYCCIKVKLLVSVHVLFSETLAELVREPASNLLENVSLVVVPESSGDLVVCHAWSVSVPSPQGCKCWRIVEAEQTILLVLPAHHVTILLLLEDLEKELP